MDQCLNATSFRSSVPIYQRGKHNDCQNKLWEAILVNGETRVEVNSISKGEKVVLSYQFCVTLERMDKVQFYFPNKRHRWSNA